MKIQYYKYSGKGKSMQLVVRRNETIFPGGFNLEKDRYFIGK